jgi:hypothetical protein
MKSVMLNVDSVIEITVFLGLLGISYRSVQAGTLAWADAPCRRVGAPNPARRRCSIQKATAVCRPNVAYLDGRLTLGHESFPKNYALAIDGKCLLQFAACPLEGIQAVETILNAPVGTDRARFV